MNNILALDLGTKMGWAMDGDSGIRDFKLSRFDSPIVRLTTFRESIEELCTRGDISIVAFEEVRHHTAIDAAHLYSAFLTVLQLYCYDNGVLYKGVPVGTIKKYATGKGNAKKPMMIEAANKFYPAVNVIDDNHADALCLFHLAKNTF